jgi:hypothetical protein
VTDCWALPRIEQNRFCFFLVIQLLLLIQYFLVIQLLLVIQGGAPAVAGATSLR